MQHFHLYFVLLTPIFFHFLLTSSQTLHHPIEDKELAQYVDSVINGQFPHPIGNKTDETPLNPDDYGFDVGQWYDFTDLTTPVIGPVIDYAFTGWAQDCSNINITAISGQFQVLETVHYKFTIEIECGVTPADADSYEFYDRFYVHLTYVPMKSQRLYSCMKGNKNWLGRTDETELTCITPIQRNFLDELQVVSFNGSAFTNSQMDESDGTSISQIAQNMKNDIKGLTDPDGFPVVGIVFGALVLSCLIVLAIIHCIIQCAQKSSYVEADRPSSTKGLMSSTKSSGNILKFQDESDNEEEEMDIEIPKVSNKND